MKFDITGQPDFAMLELDLADGEQVVAEAGAMVAMSSNIKMETKSKGGLLAGAKRMLAGESFFVNTYFPESGDGTIKFAPSSPGDIAHLPMNGGEYLMQSGAYLCHVGDIDVDAKWGGFKTFFAGEGFILLKVAGTGDCWFSSYGGLTKVDFTDGYVVDTTHLVAFESSLNYEVVPVGGLKATFLSGEGLVCRFSGAGSVWVQTRNAPSLAHWLHPFRRVQRKSS